MMTLICLGPKTHLNNLEFFHGIHPWPLLPLYPACHSELLDLTEVLQGLICSHLWYIVSFYVLWFLAVSSPSLGIYLAIILCGLGWGYVFPEQFCVCLCHTSQECQLMEISLFVNFFAWVSCILQGLWIQMLTHIVIHSQRNSPDQGPGQHRQAISLPPHTSWG